MRHARWAVFPLVLGFLASVPPVFAQQPAPAQAKTIAGGGEKAVDVQADELEYEADNKLMIGRGHVVVQRGEDVLTADYVTFRTDTQDAHAEGNVVLKHAGTIWRGEKMSYNFNTQQGDFGRFNGYVDPFYVRAEESKRVSPTEFLLKRATITTCEGDHPQFYIRARQARILDEMTIKARGVLFFLGPIPIFYVPAWTKSLRGDKTDIDIVPGYSSRMGAYLLTAYNYRLNEAMSASTHLDYRSKRGWGVGQDFGWGDPRLTYQGQLKTYYLSDDSPFQNRSEQEMQTFTNMVDSDRYRIRLSDRHGLSDRDYLITEVNYLSDPLILEDFFDDEYRHGVQPENRLSLIHRGDKFTAGLELNKRLNDFYENVDRVPEASLSISRQRVGESPVYYESQNSASQLKKVFPEDASGDADQESYEATRLDTRHTLFYPTRHFGFLNVIPRAGYRATYYSKTIEQSTETNVLSSVDSNGVVSVTNEVSRLLEEQGADLRNVYELGVELSFKAFKVLHNEPRGRDDVGLRHVVEPYALHTYIPEPNLVPEQLYQFDSVDQVDQQHDVLFGVRNKLETKRRGQVHPLVDANVWTTYRIERDEGQEDFSDLNFKTELRLVDWWMMDFDGGYDMYDNSISTFNSEIAFVSTDESRLGLEYRYKRDRRDQVAAELSLWPNNAWSFNTYGRYSFESGEMEENSLFIEHKTRCLGVGLGYKQVYKAEGQDDVQFWLQVWLLAFPKSSVELGL
ncbi:MAG: LPS assembly protein LptD [Verrucomicrobiota bacterium]